MLPCSYSFNVKTSSRTVVCRSTRDALYLFFCSLLFSWFASKFIAQLKTLCYKFPPLFCLFLLLSSVRSPRLCFLSLVSIIPQHHHHQQQYQKVQGLHACEFLNKLDLTVNFVDLDELESSVDAMRGNLHLKDLYMMGNPCQVKYNDGK